MEMKSSRRYPSPRPPPSTPFDLEDLNLGQNPPPSPTGRTSPSILFCVLLACLLSLTTFAIFLRGTSSVRDFLLAAVDRDAVVGALTGRRSEAKEATFSGANDSAPRPTTVLKDKLLGGLLAPGFGEESCLERYQSALYRKASPHKPSPYLLEKIRNYEALHQRCGPGTVPFGKALDQLKSNQTTGQTKCKYVVWISYSGLGNRILSVASTFLYALLTDRVLLVDRELCMAELFCEPFPDSTWFLPRDFPLNHLDTFGQTSPQSYGNMLKRKAFSKNGGPQSGGSLASYVYLHLGHNYDNTDKLFFCGKDQEAIKHVTWTILRSNSYYIPSLFLSSSFKDELGWLFPEKDTVFHHLGRYLFHPTNTIWGLIARYYQTYLANADERIGMQIRAFNDGPGPFQLDQIVSCSTKESILPKVNYNESISLIPNGKSKAVLVTSLSSAYFEMLRNMYWENSTENGEIISIFQPSHEKYQQSKKCMHNMKAWAEMYLLSMTDKLVISSWSTFGYVAQGLGGLQSWILVKPNNKSVPDPPCRVAMSMEPCFHTPPVHDCEKKGLNTGNVVPYVRHCEDRSWGLKLVNREEW